MYEKYLEQLEEAGKIRNLKERSINCYKNYVFYFLKYTGKNPHELTCQDVRTFLLAKRDEGLKATTLNLYNSVIRFFYRNVLHILWDDITVPRMILEHKLPTVLTVDEIDRLLEAINDIKYKAMFATYPNKFTGNYLTVSALEQVMRRAVSDAELPKNATPHCPRHSFATHLMEQGVERQNIQALLGHRDPKSTEVYLHVSPEQAKAARNILNCKTGAYGANVSVCEDCGAVQIHYNSCRNRCCPMCQAVPKEMWMDARREDVLDAPYFHLVFTVPDSLNPLIYSNQKLLYDTLYHAASATISELAANPEHLGAAVGYIWYSPYMGI